MNSGLVGFFKEDLKDSEYLRDRFLVRLQEERETQQKISDGLDKAQGGVFNRLSKPARLLVASQSMIMTLTEILKQCGGR